MAELGFDDLVITDDHRTVAGTLTLPEGAHQGPDTWWHLYLKVHASFPAETTGIAYLTGRVNAHPSASAKFLFDRGPAGGMEWHTVDIDGQVEGEEPDRDFEFTYSNVIQEDGIVPGPITLSFDIEPLNPTPVPIVDSITIDAAESGFIWDDAGPNALGLTIRPPTTPMVVGEPATFEYIVTNSSSSPARGLTLNVAPAPNMSLKDLRPINVGDVIGENHGTFTVTANEIGDGEFLVSLANNRHKARAGQIVRFTAIEGHAGLNYVLIAALIGVIAVGCLLAYWRPPSRKKIIDSN